jgi:hypothetical protein
MQVQLLGSQDGLCGRLSLLYKEKKNSKRNSFPSLASTSASPLDEEGV